MSDLSPIKRQAGQTVEQMAEQMASAPDRQHWKGQSQSKQAISAIVSHGLDLMRGTPRHVDMNDFEAVRTGTENYLAACAQASRMPSFAGLAAALGFSRRQLYRYAERDDQVGSYLQKFQTVSADALEQAGLFGAANYVMTIFLLKNSSQLYSDRNEVEIIPSRINPLDDLDPDVAREYLSSLPELDEENDNADEH